LRPKASALLALPLSRPCVQQVKGLDALRSTFCNARLMEIWLAQRVYIKP